MAKCQTMIEKLKESVEAKFGRKIAYQKDCKTLSENILELTSVLISPSTLRRFYGFLSTNSNPSRVTLDILSTYCGYNSWDDFRDKNSKTTHNEPIIELWHKAKAAANYISSKNSKALRSENPIGFSNTIAREFAHERLNYFLKSEYSATPFIGPGGYGKSTLLTKWYEAFVCNNKNENHIVLFTPAIHLEGWISKESYLDEWILSLLEIPNSNLFDTLNSTPKLAPGKFILVIDALDEIETTLPKTERLFSAVNNLALRFSGQWFKLITSSRYSTWQQFVNQANSMDAWFMANAQNISPLGTNMPPLNDAEIQQILNLTLNTDNLPRLITEEIPYDLLQIISYPYYLQLFIDTYNPTSVHLIADRLDLLTEFLKKQVFLSPLADEKSDILYSIVELSQKESTSGLCKKNDLKKIIPIHLKSAGDYAIAYNQLISFGIISEEVIKNEFGLYTTHTRITQRPLFRMLLLHTLIEQNQGITFSLFVDIEKKYLGKKSLPHIINMLYELAYKQKNIEALKPFFELQESTLKSVFVHPNIHLALAKDDLMRRELIPHYANNPRARKFLIEKFIDLNSIAKSSKLLYLNYIQNSISERDIFIGKTLLYTSNAYSLDFNWVNQFNNEYPEDIPPQNVSPLISGLWFSCKLIALLVNNNNSYKSITESINKYTQANMGQWESNDFYNFEIALAVGFICTKQYELIISRIEPLLENANNHILTQYEKALFIHKELAIWLSRKETNKSNLNIIQQYVDDSPVWARNQTAILGYSWLASHFLSHGQIDKAYPYFKKSLEISNFAGYTLYEVKLLSSLSRVLLSLGETERAKECTLLIENLTAKSNIDLGSL